MSALLRTQRSIDTLAVERPHSATLPPTSPSLSLSPPPPRPRSFQPTSAAPDFCSNSVAALLYPASSTTKAPASPPSPVVSPHLPNRQPRLPAATIPVTLLAPSLTPATSLPITKYTLYHTDWAADPLALPHNAVRRQCADLYKILAELSAPRYTTTMSHSEIEQFFTWWAAFRDFVLRLLDIEEDVLYPRFHTAALRGTSMACPRRAEWKARLVANLSSVDSGQTALIRGHPLSRFRQLVDTAISGLMAYFADKETVLVPLIHLYWIPRDARNCERDLVRELVRGGGIADLQALVFWMREMYPLLYAQWRQEYLPLPLLAQMAVGSSTWRRHQAIAAWLSGGSATNPAESRGLMSVSGALSAVASGSVSRASGDLRKKSHYMPRRHSTYSQRVRQTSPTTLLSNFGEIVPTVPQTPREDFLTDR